MQTSWKRTRQTVTVRGSDDFVDTIPLGLEPRDSDLPSQRFDVGPPSLLNSDFEPTRSGLRSLLPTLSGLRGWLHSGLMTPEALGRQAAIDAESRPQLEAARRAFASVLADVHSPAAVDLARRAGRAPTLRELWHLRSAIYTEVSVAHCESVAQRRMAALSPYFPASSGRQGNAPLTLRHSAAEAARRGAAG